ncbi:aminotransferase class IV [Sediminibacterium sp. TEGAF015]|uniref:aminotransferase class IV n=1 Tax=Sediminibacterium sp. TEGAF015 TaxID=575378 RepID=UPI00220B0EAD|nr:aminotransferase class IV [Sediminibacterium sp. TEGAF015]BDQ12197.1 branched chain amino acid aminotransferase [Sediminibacterium sp. TEGAF015]
MSDLFVFVNNKLVPANDAKISVTDLAIQRGYGIFDFLVVVNGRPVYLEDHLNRFYHSAAAMHLPVPLDRPALVEAIQQLMNKNKLPNAGIRITLTGGDSPDGYSIGVPNIIITQNPFQYSLSSPLKGIRLITQEHQRQLPHIKTIDYAKAIFLQPTIKAAGADDVLYHTAGIITECPRSNFFIVNNQQEIITPDKQILAGVTRAKILLNTQFLVKEAPINFETLANAKEAFVTSSTKNVLPVVSIDGKPVGNGEPGPVTQELLNWMIQQKGILSTNL